jgi:hypothetical protein
MVLSSQLPTLNTEHAIMKYTRKSRSIHTRATRWFHHVSPLYICGENASMQVGKTTDCVHDRSICGGSKMLSVTFFRILLPGFRRQALEIPCAHDAAVARVVRRITCALVPWNAKPLMPAHSPSLKMTAPSCKNGNSRQAIDKT